MPIPFLPSTKSRFLCFFGLRNPRFQAFRAQNRHFCVRTGNFPLVFAPFEHKIGIFVLFLPSEPSFSGFLSTKSVFLCQKEQFSPGFYPFRAQNRGFCALVLGNMASGSRKARKFLFLHAFKLLLPAGELLLLAESCIVMPTSA